MRKLVYVIAFIIAVFFTVKISCGADTMVQSTRVASQGESIRLIYFTSTTCSACEAVKSEINTLSSEGAKVDVFWREQDMPVFTKLRVTSIPTVLVTAPTITGEWVVMERITGQNMFLSRIRGAMSQVRQRLTGYKQSLVITNTVDGSIGTTGDIPLPNTVESSTSTSNGGSNTSEPIPLGPLNAEKDNNTVENGDAVDKSVHSDESAGLGKEGVPLATNKKDDTVIVWTKEQIDQQSTAVIDQVLAQVSSKLTTKIESVIDSSKEKCMGIVQEQAKTTCESCKDTILAWLIKVFWNVCLFAALGFIVIAFGLSWLHKAVTGLLYQIFRVFKNLYSLMLVKYNKKD